ncbi:sigma-70 family RNA polymerase sigma factor [Gemmata sp. JC673]|uniref:Sigma-70 family RNA polymerase sigma factor n=1 Tax=Gemmata algarum TaxID=2975278 RepID=A0ABU5EVA2_9BACT|nr:sigma-70 family RNA polymerase sigma factor [Gemmata algarum]MDY3558390.1 sigma-70 family RNA polymerase sigma factor [Gemmata algarum]
MSAAPPSLATLLDRWDRLIWVSARRYARAWRLDPEEVQAEAVAGIVRQFARYDPARERSSFPTWALMQVRRAAIEQVRGRVRVRREVGWDAVLATDPGGRHEVADLAAATRDPDPAEQVAAAEAREAVAAALAGLPADQREAIRLHFWGPDVSLSRYGREQLAAGLEALRARLAPRGEEGT